MDQTIVTVIGMIAAFLTASVTAFLAEPVRLYFQNRSDLRKLRLALYKELVYNYSLLDQQVRFSHEDASSKIRDTMLILTEFNIRTECYRYAISRELHLFYQLDEANEINEVFSILALATRLPDMQGIELEEPPEPEAKDRRLITTACRKFLDSVAMYFFTGKLDKQLLARLVSKSRYEKVLSRGNYTLGKLVHPAG